MLQEPAESAPLNWEVNVLSSCNVFFVSFTDKASGTADKEKYFKGLDPFSQSRKSKYFKLRDKKSITGTHLKFTHIHIHTHVQYVREKVKVVHVYHLGYSAQISFLKILYLTRRGSRKWEN